MSESGQGYIFCGRKGDLKVYLTHVKFPEDHDEHGALYIRNENRTNEQGGHPAFLVTLRDLWMFRPEDRDRGKFHSYHEMRQELANASIALYGFDVHEYRHRIHDAILEFADDVKNLKPPEGMTAEQWKRQLARHGVQVRVNGQRVV